MKKIIAFAAVASAAFMMASCGGGKTNEKSQEEAGNSDNLFEVYDAEEALEEEEAPRYEQLKTQSDSLSYYMGYSFGKSLQMQQNMLTEEIDMEIFKRGAKEALDSKEIDEAEMGAFMNNYMYNTNPEKFAKVSENWLSKQDKKRGVQRTESGLRYKIVREGNTEKMATKDADVVKVNYEGKLMNGHIFDSSYKREQPAEFALNRVIKGWTEGMKLVGEGGEIILYIPSDLAYGQWGNQRGGIGPNNALEFRVEVLEVKPAAVEVAE